MIEFGINFPKNAFLFDGLKHFVLTFEPSIEFIAVILKTQPRLLVAAGGIGQELRIQRQNARLELAGDAKAFKLRRGEAVSQRTDFAPCRNGAPGEEKR